MRRVVQFALCLCAVLLLAGCGTSVPDLAGLTRSEARKAVSASGLALGVVSYDEGSDAATGTVVAQAPAAGERAAGGSSVDVTLAGSAPVAAPVVTGLVASEASAALAAAGLRVGSVVETYSADVPAGQLISQDPASGADAPKGSPVDLVVSKGPRPIVVPKVVGMTESVAESTLTAAGLKVTVSRKVDSAPIGIVIAQAPSSGAVRAGTAVSITVSLGTLSPQARLIGAWKGSDGSAYTFRVRNRVVTPGGGVVRYRLTNGVLLIYFSGRALTATIVWVSPDRFTLAAQTADGPGPTITYDRVK